MGNMMSNSKSDAATSSINLDMDIIIKDFKTHLHSLEGAALSIKASTNAQYELVQNFLGGKEALAQPTIEIDACSSSEVTTKSLNNHEKRVLAFIQDDICVQATVIENIVTHLKALDDPTLSQEHLSSRTIDKDINESRMDLNYLRAQAEEQKKTLKKTERKIDELSKVAFKRKSNTLQAEGQTDCLVEKEGMHGGRGNHQIFESNTKSNSNKRISFGYSNQTRADQMSSYDHESNNGKGKSNNRFKQGRGYSDSSKITKLEEDVRIQNLELKRMSEVTIQADKELKMLKEEMEMKDEELHRREEEVIKSGKELAALLTEKNEMEQSQNREYSILLNDMEDKQCKNDTELKALENELKEKKTEILDMQIEIGKIETHYTAEINQLNIKCENSYKNQEQYLWQRDNAKRENSELVLKIRRLNNDTQKMKTEIGEKDNVIRILKREKEIALEKMRQRRKVSVMLYTPRRGDLLNTVVGELRTMLTQQFDAQQKADLTVLECENASQIEPNKPVLVVCINASRLGTDVTNAMQGIRGSSQVAVVILHHKEIHALPNQSSERVLTSQEYKSLGGIIDMAFLSSRGLYPCEMNKAAVTALMDFIRQKNIQ